MIIGTYADGRPLTYDEQTLTFAIGGAIVTPDQVVAYDKAGQLNWVNLETRAWAWKVADARAEAANAPAPAPAQKPTPLWVKILVPVLIGGALLSISPLIADTVDGIRHPLRENNLFGIPVGSDYTPITKAQYDQVQMGMDLGQVQTILGRDGHMVTTQRSRVDVVAGYMWANRDGSAVSIIFRNGQVVRKQELLLH